jgi:hypothetical protein
MAHQTDVLPPSSPSPTYTAAAADDETTGLPIVLVREDDLRPDDIVVKTGGRQADTNVSYRAILEEWREIYEMAGQLEKNKIAAAVLREMATKGLRFLVPYYDRHPSNRNRFMTTDDEPIYQVIAADSFGNRKRMKRHLRKVVTQYYRRLNLTKQQLAQRHAHLKATLKATRLKQQAAASTPSQSGMMKQEEEKPAEEEVKPGAAAAAAQDDSSAWSSIWETSEEGETTDGSEEDQGSERMVMPSGTCTVAVPGFGQRPISSSSTTTATTIRSLLFQQPEDHHGTTDSMGERGILQGPEAQGMGRFKGETALERFPESHMVAAAIKGLLQGGGEPFGPGGGASLDGAASMDLFFKGTQDGGEVNGGAATASSLRLQGPVMAAEKVMPMMSQNEEGIENLVIDDSIFEDDDEEEDDEEEVEAATTIARPPRAVCPCPQHGSPAKAENAVVAAGLHQRHQQQQQPPQRQQQVVPRFSYHLLQRNHYRLHGPVAETLRMHDDDGVDDVVMRARAALRSAAVIMPGVMAGDPLEPISMVYDEDDQADGGDDARCDSWSARRSSAHDEKTYKNWNKTQG